MEFAGFDELTCTAKCEYTARYDDVGKQEESERSTKVLEIGRLVFWEIHPELQLLGIGSAREVALLQIGSLRLHSSDAVEIFPFEIIAVGLRLHRAGSTLGDGKNSLYLLEDEPGK
jgi:hypothetical protein